MRGTSVLTIVLSVTTLINGFSNYRDRIPNGGQVPHPCKPNYMWRGVGHTNPLGGGDRNAFGRDFRQHGLAWSRTLCELDSDGDGRTNGEELGDPDCTWTPGTLPNRTTSLTHPGVCDPWGHSNCNASNTWVNCDIDSFVCDALEDPETRNITIRYPSTPVPNTETNYMCMTFDLPGDDVYHLVGVEPVIDNAQVMHHIILYGCPETSTPPTLATPTPCGMEAGTGCNSIIGLWAVGHAGSCVHEETGFKFGRGLYTRVKMEFHWNNPELRSDYRDSSGLRLYYTPKLRPNSAATFAVGQRYLEIPPLQPSFEVTGSCSSQCSQQLITQPTYVVDAVNHMHYLGKSQKVEVFRDGNLFTTLTNDEVYSYDSPVIHVLNPPVQLLPGDEIKTTCTFSSQSKNTTTYFGDATSDEMCFAFLTIYPEEALPYKKSCVAYRNLSSCERCDMSKFTDGPWAMQFGAKVYSSCTPFAPCRPECQQLVDQIKDEACLQGDNFQLIKDTFLQSHQGTYILAALDSCMRSRYTEPCDNNTINAATALTSGLVSMVTLLVVAIFYRVL